MKATRRVDRSMLRGLASLASRPDGVRRRLVVFLDPPAAGSRDADSTMLQCNHANHVDDRRRRACRAGTGQAAGSPSRQRRCRTWLGGASGGLAATRTTTLFRCSGLPPACRRSLTRTFRERSATGRDRCEPAHEDAAAPPTAQLPPFHCSGDPLCRRSAQDYQGDHSHRLRQPRQTGTSAGNTARDRPPARRSGLAAQGVGAES